MNRQVDQPLIGMLCWEKRTIPSALRELSELPGNATNPLTFSFPVLYEPIIGANLDTVVKQPSGALLVPMIQACQRLEKKGIRAITTSCGFNALFQEELANSVNIPVFTSSLLQVSFVHRMLRADRTIGIITADKTSLTRAHLEAVGIDQSIPICIAGLEKTIAFSHSDVVSGDQLDIEGFKEELLDTVVLLLEEAPSMGAIVLECTDLPPFANEIAQAANLPVFDIVTLTKYIYTSLI